MNPSPTDTQWLLLYQVEDGDVSYDPERKQWFVANGTSRSVATGRLQRLHQLGLVDLMEQWPDEQGRQRYVAQVTAEGMEVLKRRSVYDVLERLNS